MWKRNTDTFIGCENDYSDADLVLLGAPFDSTASFRPGARFGPRAIRAESFGIETYSPYQNRDLEDTRVYDGGDLELCIGDAALALTQIEERIRIVVRDGKRPVLLGGEHLVSLGAVRVLADVYPDLCIVHFDAHADLRDDYLGARLSHATVLRRIWELTGDGRIFQFGIRSGDRSEFEWGAGRVQTSRFGFDGLEETVQQLRDKPVYVTLDMDILDPAEFPGTGTPEAGGVRFSELLQALRKLEELRIVGFDLVELAPALDASGVSTAAACKLLREMLLMVSK